MGTNDDYGRSDWRTSWEYGQPDPTVYQPPQLAYRPGNYLAVQRMPGDQTAALAILARKSAGVAALLTFLLVGAGLFYCGRIARGFAFLAAMVLAWLSCIVLIGFIAVPVVFIWALIDAVNLANRHNAEVAYRLLSQPR